MALKVVVIGVGARGRHWIRRTQAHPEFEVVAVVDPAETSREAVAREFPDAGLAAFARVDEAAGQVEAEVAIVSAVSWHRRQNCQDALEAGWHLLVEKPFALSVADARAIVHAAEQAGRVVAVGQNYRFGPTVGTMRTLVGNGEVGEIGHGIFVRHRKRYAGNTYQKEMRHNYLWEMGVHDLDLIRFTLGLKPLRVNGFSFQPPWGDYHGETSVSALYEFEGGVKVNYFGAWASHVPEYHWRVDGSKGSLRLGKQLEQATPDEGEWREVESLGEFGGEGALLDELAAAISGVGETSTSGRDNLWTVAMMEAVVRSTEAGGESIDVAAMLE